VTRIGFNEIGDIALAVSLIKKFSRTSSLLDYPAFWRHSLGAATLAGSLARRLKDDCSPDKHNEYFMAGLLHDIGILLYDQFFRDDFAKIISHAKNTGISFVNAEANLFPEESHAALGGALLGHWRLGEAVAAGVGHHHDFDSSTQDHHAPIRQLTGAAEWLLRRANDKTFEGPDDCALKFILGTEPKEPADLEELLTLANEASAQAEAFFL
jgi:HD-like signal output (HDOD) protein